MQPLQRTTWQFLRKLKELPYDSTALLLAIYPEKTIITKDTCTSMFTAALFIIARPWKQPKCPSTEEWIKMWHIYATECLHIYAVDYYLAIKGKEIVPFAEMWMGLETVIHSEVRKRKINTIY